MLMAREWGHLKMVKRSGRHLKQGGMAACADGELAVRCRSCPIDGVNLPEEWRTSRKPYASPSPTETIANFFIRWLYRIHIAQDANMKLNNRARRRGLADAPLQPGSAYMVDPVPFNAFIKNKIDEKEVNTSQLISSSCINMVKISTCAGFQAILLSGLNLTRGLVSTGIAALGCRHESWLPQCGVNLQKGER
jgi:hypothetical protein